MAEVESKPVEPNNGPYSETEILDLDTVRTLRQGLLKRLVGDLNDPQLPDKSADKILLDQLINGHEDQTHKKAKMRMQHKDSQVANGLKEGIVALINNYKEPPRREVSDDELAVPASFKRPEFAPGALDTGMVSVSMKDLGL